MKKYLMKGFAAIVFCGAIASCSHDMDSGSDAVQSKVQETYEKAFVTHFGTPASTQTWGFGTTAKANTRATGEFADHVGAYPDANMWTSKGFLAPDPLTQSQKLRAQYYFQMNRIVNPNRPNYGTKDFFVQQVYDGGKDPMNGKSAEKYLAANGSTLIESGEHMDHLTAGPNHLHIYNFNNGTCSTNGEVADRDQTHVNNTDQQHSDEIMLMLNTPTSCFGYANSDASCVRDDRWTLVSAATIDAFCDNDQGFSAWLKERLTDERGDVKCVDDFNRDYIGFDFDMIPDESCYVSTPVRADGSIVYDTYNQANEIDHYIYTYAQYGALNEANDSRVFNEDGTVSTYASWNTEIIIDSKKIPYVVTNTNMYCAIGDHANIGIGGMDGFNDYATIGHYVEGGANDNTLYLNNLPNEQSDKKAINMKFIAKLVREGYLPVAGKDLKRWVKIGGCNDGYFSDWIVTFMPADAGDEEEGDEIMVIAEDLTIDDVKPDFDFNDVVFKVKWNKTANTVNVTLLAAGGTLPLYIGGTELGSEEENYTDGYEVHAKFAEKNPNKVITTGTMINTYENRHEEYETPTFEVTNFNHDATDIGQVANSIKVAVKKYGKMIELKAPAGQVPTKIAVGKDFEWCDERQDIDEKYKLTDGTPLFKDYVQGKIGDNWYRMIKDDIDSTKQQ